MAVPRNVKSNEFLSSTVDYRLRPYTVGLDRQGETLATILVYKRGDERPQSIEGVDYLKYFESQVKELTTASVTGFGGGSRKISVGTPEQPDGQITNESLDGKNEYYGVFNNFSLLNVQESHEQIVKLHVNFSADWNAFFFGEKPRVYQFSGIFLDSKDYPYYQEFMTAYDKYLAGRKSIERKMQTKFIYDGKIVDGYMLNISTSQTAADQLIKTFQFTVLVKGLYWARVNKVPRVNSVVHGTDRYLLEEQFNGLNNLGRLRNTKQVTAEIALDDTRKAPPVRSA